MQIRARTHAHYARPKSPEICPCLDPGGILSPVKKPLIIVESPTKARTIKKFLPARYAVKASVGHVRDLPKSTLGVDVEHDFAPRYLTIKGKGDVIKELRGAVKGATEVYLATDPDREGEAIAWHLAELLKLPHPKRIELHEITKEAAMAALRHPTSIDMDRVNAQQARRILDRLVGYKISPLLWAKVRGGLSAGRVQSVAVKLIVDREREILAFVPREYWSITAQLAGAADPARTSERTWFRTAARSWKSPTRRRLTRLPRRWTEPSIASRRSRNGRCDATRRRRLRPLPCSKRPRGNSKCGCAGRCRSRRRCTRASISAAARVPSDSSPTCAPTRPDSASRRGMRRATSSSRPTVRRSTAASATASKKARKTRTKRFARPPSCARPIASPERSNARSFVFIR